MTGRTGAPPQVHPYGQAIVVLPQTFFALWLQGTAYLLQQFPEGDKIE